MVVYEQSVYMMSTIEKGVYKIGRSVSPETRLSALPKCKSVVISTKPFGYMTIESSIHNMVKSNRVKLEWGREYFEFNNVEFFYMVRFFEYINFKIERMSGKRFLDYNRSTGIAHKNSYEFYASQRYAHETTLFMFGDVPNFSDEKKIASQRYDYCEVPPLFALNADFISWKESQRRY